MNRLDTIKVVDGIVYLNTAYTRLSFKVTAMFTDVNACNAYLETHPNEGVLAESGDHIFCASHDDEGIILGE